MQRNIKKMIKDTLNSLDSHIVRALGYSFAETNQQLTAASPENLENQASNGSVTTTGDIQQALGIERPAKEPAAELIVETSETASESTDSCVYEKYESPAHTDCETDEDCEKFRGATSHTYGS